MSPPFGGGPALLVGGIAGTSVFGSIEGEGAFSGLVLVDDESRLEGFAEAVLC